MKRITIGGKEYVFEFSIAASLYNECTEEIMNGFVSGGMIQSAAQDNDIEGAMHQFISSVANIPQRALTLFYAALMEHHGVEFGDGTIGSKKAATKLLGEYMKEHPDDNDGKGKSFYDVMSEMMELMVADNFFEMIGLDKMMEGLSDEKPKRKKRTPQNPVKPGENTSTE